MTHLENLVRKKLQNSSSKSSLLIGCKGSRGACPMPPGSSLVKFNSRFDCIRIVANFIISFEKKTCLKRLHDDRKS